MAVIEKSASVMIKRPIVEVFTFVTNPNKFNLWQPFVMAAEVTSKGKMAPGATYRYQFQAMGKVIETSGVITEYKPFHTFSYQSTDSPFPIKGGFAFKELEGFVEMTAYGNTEPEGYFSLTKAMIGLMLGRQIYSMLRTLKEILEKDDRH